MLLFMISTLASAANDLDMKLLQHGQSGPNATLPKLTLITNKAADRLTVQFKCGRTTFSEGPMSTRARQEIDIPLSVRVGQHRCRGSISASYSDNSGLEAPLDFNVTMHEPLKIKVDRGFVDLKKRALTASIDRPAKGFEITVFNADMTEIGHGSLELNGHGGNQTITWTQRGEETALIRIKGIDQYGFWATEELLPWSYNVPHEDVVFASNKSNIDPSETHKLVSVNAEIEKIYKKYNKIAKVNLYVAGYTDSVGDASSNKKLSERRAKEIANWFLKSGFKGNIYYQGFGEKGQAVATADNVDEARNRRSLYIVAAEKPGTSHDLPFRNWKPLK